MPYRLPKQRAYKSLPEGGYQIGKVKFMTGPSDPVIESSSKYEAIIYEGYVPPGMTEEDLDWESQQLESSSASAPSDGNGSTTMNKNSKTTANVNENKSTLRRLKSSATLGEL